MVFGICGINLLNLLFDRLLDSDRVCSEILSLLSIFLEFNNTRLFAAKLFLIIELINWKISSYIY